MPDDLDVQSLRIVRAIADHGTITAAAASLGSSQPAVSQHLRRLERRLGTALLERRGRGVRLTEAGQVLARHGATVTAALDAAAAEVAALTGLRTGRVRLLAFPSSSATLVPAALARLRREHPDLRVSLDECEPPESLQRLREGGCDIALAFSYPGTDLGRGEDDLTGLVTRPLLQDPPVLALPTGHPLADARRLHLRDLADQTWIAGCARCRGHLLQTCSAAGFSPSVAFATDDYVAVLGLVAAGLGIALLPGLVLPVAARHPGVAVRSVGGATARTVSTVTTPDLLRVPAVAVTIEALADAATGH
jgi:molybdate transport repressor ModE-like protein